MASFDTDLRDTTDADEDVRVLAVVRAETEAFLLGNLEEMASHWVQDETAMRLVSWGSQGIKIMRGWSAVAERMKEAMELFPSENKDFDQCIQWDHVQVVVGRDIARVVLDQIGLGGAEFQIGGLQHELKILQKCPASAPMGRIRLIE